MSGMETATKRLRHTELVERDGAVCAYCGAVDVELTIDHKTPPGRGGSHKLENLQLLCASCNASKGQQTDEEANRGVRFASGVARAGFTVAHNVVIFDRSLSPGARLLYLQLRHYGYLAEHFSREIPDQEEMAANLGIKERALRPYVTELVDAGLVRVQRRGRGLTNRYVIAEPTLGAGERAQDRHSTAGLERQSTAAETGSVLPLLKSEDRKTALSKESARSAMRNPIYDALVAECYPAGAKLTRREQQQVLTAARNIASGGGTADLVTIVRAAYQRHTSYSKCALTAMALSNRWSELAPTARLEPACDDCGVAGGRHAEGCGRLAA